MIEGELNYEALMKDGCLDYEKLLTIVDGFKEALPQLFTRELVEKILEEGKRLRNHAESKDISYGMMNDQMHEAYALRDKCDEENILLKAAAIKDRLRIEHLEQEVDGLYEDKAGEDI